ncbi:hypothetical protein [Rhizobacter sp. LjRoot28]|uniref:hypothetical protein n=1 Tax=Rhizobacter sp. LjRoot28 TaxID=3342309 RepID=UPI003ECD72DB
MAPTPIRRLVPARHVVPLLLLLVGLGAPGAAAALTFSGTFWGMTQGASVIPTNPETPWPIEFFIDAPVQGSFRVDIPDAVLAEASLDTFTLFGPGRSHIDFDVRGARFSFDAGAGAPAYGIFMAESDGTRATFWSDFRPRFDGAIFSFYGAPGALLGGDRPDSLQIGPDTVERMEASFADPYASYAVNIRVDGFRFDPVAAPVPEPGAGLALLVGLGLLRLHHRRALRTASRSVAS